MDKDEAYRKFVGWFATPEKERSPKSIPELVLELGIQDTDVSEFSQKESFAMDVMNFSINWAVTKFPELIQSTYDEYMRTKSPALLTAYQRLLEFNKEKDKNVINLNFLNISDDRFKQILTRGARTIGAGETGLLD